VRSDGKAAELLVYRETRTIGRIEPDTLASHNPTVWSGSQWSGNARDSRALLIDGNNGIHCPRNPKLAGDECRSTDRNGVGRRLRDGRRLPIQVDGRIGGRRVAGGSMEFNANRNRGLCRILCSGVLLARAASRRANPTRNKITSETDRGTYAAADVFLPVGSFQGRAGPRPPGSAADAVALDF
jgi:hypothetical protein